MKPANNVLSALGMESVGGIDPMLQIGLEEENKAYSAAIERAVALQTLYGRMSSEGMSQRLYASMEALDVDLSRFTYSTESIDSSISTKIGLETLHDMLVQVLIMLRRHLGKIIAIVIAIAAAFMSKSLSGGSDRKEIDSSKLCEEAAVSINTSTKDKPEEKPKVTASVINTKLIELFNQEELSILEEEFLSGVYADTVVENTFTQAMNFMHLLMVELHDVMGSTEAIEEVDGDPADDHTSRKIHDILKSLESKIHASGNNSRLVAYSYSNLKESWGTNILPISKFWINENKEHCVTVRDAKFKHGLFWEFLDGHTFSPVANNLFTYKKLIKEPAGTIKVSRLDFHTPHWNNRLVQGHLDGIKKQREVLDYRLANVEKTLSKKSTNKLRNSKSGYCWPQVKPHGEKVPDGYVSTSTIMSGILINSALVIGFHRSINQLSLCMADSVRAAGIANDVGQRLLTFSGRIAKQLD